MHNFALDHDRSLIKKKEKRKSTAIHSTFSIRVNPVSHNFSRRGRVYFASKRQITSRFSLLSPRRRVFQPVSYEYTIRHDRPRAVPIHLQQRLNFVKKHVRENLRPPILFDLLLPYRYSLRFTPVGVSGGCDYELTWRFKEGVKLNTRFVEITCGRENEY